MIDTRAIAQEVQDQVLAAMHKGHEQVRKSQAQVRKSRETVTVAIRTGNEIAKAVMPSIPALQARGRKLPSLSELASPDKLRASAQELAGHVLASQRKLAGNAHEVAGQVFATQRKLAGNAQEVAGQVFATQRKFTEKALHAAGPLVVESVARLTQVADSLAPGRRNARPVDSEPLAVAATTTVKPAETAADAKPAATARADQDAAGAATAPAAATPAKATTAKPRTAKATTAKPSAAKARPVAAKPAKAKAGDTRTAKK
jgi:hypothetical protein